MDGSLPAADRDPATVRPDRPGQDLYEGALPGAVRAHERMDLARLDCQRGRLQCDDRTVALGDARGLQQETRRRGTHTHHSCGGYAGDAGETGVPSTLAAHA